MDSTRVRARQSNSRQPARAHPTNLSRNATDDEILGLLDSAATGRAGAEESFGSSAGPQPGLDSEALDEPGPTSADAGASDQDNAADRSTADQTPTANSEPENLRAVFDAHPEARRAWRDAQAYRETFATPEDARAATALLADLDRMDQLFFSQRPEDHAELARAVAQLNPAAFASLATAIAHQDQELRNRTERVARQNTEAPQTTPATDPTAAQPSAASLTPAQADFFHATNAAAVQSVIDAIESQVRS